MKKANIKSPMLKENDCSNWHVAELQLKYQEYNTCTVRIDSSVDAVKVVRNSINQDEFMIQEHFYALYLNSAHEVLGFRTISSGGIKAVTISPQHILGIALLLNATSLIVFHNHPSERLSPSDADIKMTKELICGANILDIDLLDHIILTKTAYNSMSNNNILDFGLKTDINQFYLKTHKIPKVEKECSLCADRLELVKTKDEHVKALQNHVEFLKQRLGLNDWDTKPQNPVRVVHEENQQFKTGQKVFLNRWSDVNKKLPDGLKKGDIYTIDEVIKCSKCGNILLGLQGAYYPGVSSRICVCGKADFPANAFYSIRFEIAHLRVV